jgi:hypothetical protein
MLTLIIIVLLICVLFGGYRLGPGIGYYGGGAVGLVLLILLILLLLGYFPHGRLP